MFDTAHIHDRAAHLIREHGLHTGDQFIGPDGALDVAVAYYLPAENIAYADAPDVFRTDEETAVLLISCSARTMQALRELAETLDTPMRATRVSPDHDVPDWIDTVSAWPSQVIAGRRVTTSEVIGRILRVAETRIPAQSAA